MPLCLANWRSNSRAPSWRHAWQQRLQLALLKTVLCPQAPTPGYHSHQTVTQHTPHHPNFPSCLLRDPVCDWGGGGRGCCFGGFWEWRRKVPAMLPMMMMMMMMMSCREEEKRYPPAPLGKKSWKRVEGREKGPPGDKKLGLRHPTVLGWHYNSCYRTPRSRNPCCCKRGG